MPLKLSREQIHYQIYFLACLAIAFVLPLNERLTNIPLVILFFNWLAEGKYFRKWEQLKKNKTAFLFIGFYVYHLVGLLWTENMVQGSFDIQVKIALWAFPLFLGSISLSKKNLYQIKWAFLISCLLSFIIAVAHALYQNNTGNEIGYTYIPYSVLMHPGYQAFIVSVGVAFLLQDIFLRRGFQFQKDWLLVMLLACFLVHTVLLLSRMAIVTSLVMILLTCIIYTVNQKKIVVPTIMLLMLLAIGWFSIQYIAPVKTRFIQMKNTLTQRNFDITQLESEKAIEAKGSSDLRLYIWKASWQVFQENPIWGAGTGDVKLELGKKYKKYQIKYAKERLLNAHNQYFQTLIGLGLVGLLWLLTIIFTMMYNGIQWNNYALFLFAISVMLHFMTESFLEIQVGEAVFNFFGAFFLFQMRKDEK